MQDKITSAVLITYHHRILFIRHVISNKRRRVHISVRVHSSAIYLVHINLPQDNKGTVATYADNTAILACSCPTEASMILHSALNNVDEWLTNWRIKTSTSKSVQVTFTLRRGNCPLASMCSNQLQQRDWVKYLEMYLDRRLTWRKQMEKKREEINKNYRGLYWLQGRNSKLSLDNKLLIYKTAKTSLET